MLGSSDGATYHSHVSARERDRLRQEVLEGLGWKILRVWSTDWYKSPKTIIKQIDQTIKEILDTEVHDAAVMKDQGFEKDSHEKWGWQRDAVNVKPVPESQTKQDQSQEDIIARFKLLDTEIRKEFPDTAEDQRLLRKEMVEYFLSKLPIDISEFKETCPARLRTQTSTQEASRYLNRVCQIISEWA